MHSVGLENNFIYAAVCFSDMFFFCASQVWPTKYSLLLEPVNDQHQIEGHKLRVTGMIRPSRSLYILGVFR